MQDIRYDFERMEEPFWKLQVKGIYFWHLVRMAFYEMVMEALPGMGAAHPDQYYKMSMWKKIGLGVKMVLGAVVRNPRFRFRKQRRFLIVCAPRKTKCKGRYIFTLLEPALEILEGDYNYLERPELDGHRRDPGRKCLAYSDYMEFTRLINQVRGKYFMNEQEQSVIDEIIASVERTFSIKLDTQKVYGRVNSNLTGFFTYYKAYEKLIDRIKPRCILETTHYEVAKMSLNKLAHERGIKVYELQHGVMNLQYEVPDVDVYMPDELLTFGEYWNHSADYPGRMTPVGNPHLEECVREMKTEVDIPTVLILSGGPVAKTMVQLALDMERYSREHDLKIRILFKLHPNEYQTWRMLHPRLQDSAIEVIDNNERDLYYYFSISTHQIGVSSTALYEGLAFHLKTIIFKAYRYDMMMDIIQAGYAQLAANLEEVMELILNQEDTELDLEGFWKQNARDNLENILRKE